MIALNPDTTLASAGNLGANAPLAGNTVVTPAALTAALNWRYAVKQYDTGRALDDATWNALQDALVLAPSSVGLQPWKFVVVDDKAVRARLRAAAWNQPQFTDADKLIVFAARAGYDASDVDRYIARVAQVRGVAVESLAAYRDMALGIVARPEAERDAWASRQTYIALGALLTSAAALGVDATPMEGLDAAAFDDILGLKGSGYHTYAAAALGYRSREDKYALLPKVRFPRADVIHHV